VERNFDISPSSVPISALLSQALLGGCYSKSGSESPDFSLKTADNSVTVTEFAVTESDSGFYRDQMRVRIVRGPFRRFGAWFSCDSGSPPPNRESRRSRSPRPSSSCYLLLRICATRVQWRPIRADIRLELKPSARNSAIRFLSACLSGQISRANVEGEGVIEKPWKCLVNVPVPLPHHAYRHILGCIEVGCLAQPPYLASEYHDLGRFEPCKITKKLVILHVWEDRVCRV
jgi:hypothetical protein